MLSKRLIKSNDAGGGACTNTVDLYNPFPDGGGVALYQLNGDATDVSGNYDGTATNVTYGTGQFGQAGFFNGSSSKIELPTNVFSFSSFTLSGWVNVNANTDENTLIEITDSNNYPNHTTILISAGNGANTASARFLFRNYLENEFNYRPTGDSSTLGWRHYAMTYDGSTINCYINGSIVQTGSLLLTNPIGSITGVRLGLSSGSRYLNGSIDQVRIFSRALRPYEVEALYTEEYCTPTIVPSEHFNTVTYTGNSSTQSVTGVGFQPDLVWIKRRNTTEDHALFDSVRGALKMISTNLTAAEYTTAAPYEAVSSFDSDGFTTGDNGATNRSPNTYVAWNFKAGGAAVTNTDGTITSQVSANTEAGFSIVSWDISVTQEEGIGHGLGQKPSIVILKDRSESEDWFVYTDVIDGSMDYLHLNLTEAKSNSGRTLFNSDVFYWDSLGSYIAYCFAEVEGFSNFGSYVGTGASGNSIVTGFEPAFVMIKRTDTTSQWLMYDNKRGQDFYLYPNLSAAESGPDALFQFLENGFQLTGGNADWNASGGSYIYMAFAADPTAVEPTLEDSFNTVVYTGSSSPKTVTGTNFQSDFIWIKNRDNASANHYLIDSVRGIGTGGTYKFLSSDLTLEENSTTTNHVSAINDNGFIVQNNHIRTNAIGEDYVAWAWKGAEIPAINSNGSIPSVVSANPAAGFSIVSYNSNGTAGSTIGHGLASSPDMIIIKNRDDVDKWAVYHSAIGGTKFLVLNETAVAVSSSAYWNNTNPNSNTFTVGSTSPVNSPNNENYIAYCFAEVAGFSKFGSYTGTGSAGNAQTLGFDPAFIMFKNTSSTGQWWIHDNKRGDDKRLFAESSAAESTSGSLTTNATGFSFNDANNNLNASGQTYIYMAFANQF